jgi:serine/threonine-protein kinase
MIGTTLSHHKVLEKIGQGGMGEVYRAEDTNLSREVAIKVLPEQFTKDPQRLARFEREAKLLASLNHPNIAAIYGLEEADGVRFLALELVEGETLAERVARGPVPVEEALGICRQIAEGVEAAHEKGVIHCDLKPANVKVTPEGKVKILDFGLAKAFEEETPVTDISQSPTLTEEMTRAGVILGTAAYMSPEQAKGKPVDKRADIFAFGAVLYELLTGKRAFGGETITETIAAVLKSDPEWGKLPSDTPWRIKELLEDCLQKDSHDRPHDISHTRIQIKKALKEPTEVLPIGVGNTAQPAGWKIGTLWLLTLAMAVIAGLALWSPWRESTPGSGTVTRFAIDYPPKRTPGEPPIFSPDGQYLAFAGYDRLYLQRMDEFDAKPVPGTEGPISWEREGIRSPFFSPDSQSIGYMARGFLYKVRVAGGAPVRVTGVPAVFSGASWGADGTIVIGLPSAGLMQVSSDGGTLEQFTSLDYENGERSHRMPHTLPDGRNILFTIGSVDGPLIGVASLETGEHRRLIEGSSPRYLPTGHLVYLQLDSLMAVPFDLGTLELGGTPVPVVDGVLNWVWGAVPVPYFTISNAGSLAYLSGRQVPFVRRNKLVWVDREGRSKPVTEEENEYLYPRASPDGKQLAVSLQTDEGRSVWLYDLEGGRSRRLTFEGMHFVSLWTRDGQRLTFHSDHAGGQGIFWREVRGSSLAEELSINEYVAWPSSWSPDDAVLAYTEGNPVTNGDIWLLLREGGDPIPFAQTAYDERHAAFSPDGRFIAYVSDESGQAEVYVQPYPGSAGKEVASTNGGIEPVWSADGQELFYRLGNELLVVDVELESELALGPPRVLFQGSFSPTRVGPPNYDVSPDGTRFIMVEENDNLPTEVNVVLNWFEELKRLVPTP